MIGLVQGHVDVVTRDVWQQCAQKRVVHLFERQAGITNDALDLGEIALGCRSEDAAGGNRLEQERLLFKNAGDELDKAPAGNGVEIGKVRGQPRFECLDCRPHRVYWRGLVHHDLR